MVGRKTTFANLKQLDQDFFKQLCTNANKLLQEPVDLPDFPTGVELEKILDLVAAQRFESQFGYPYLGGQSVPRDVAADAKNDILAIQDICSITDGSDESDQIGKYVDSTLLKSLQLEWARAAARPDLVDQGKLMFTDTSRFWNTWPYVEKYHSPNDPEENSFKIDAIAVYCNVPTPNLETNLVIYYIGVSYEILSPTKAAKVNLLNTLIENANGLLVEPIPIPPYPSWGDLEYILGIFGKQRFETRFGFVYLDEKTQPKDIAPNGSLSGVALLFTEDISQSDTLPNLIPEYILSKMKTIPPWAQDSASIALKNQVAELFNRARTNIWSEVSFENSYDSDITTDNSCKTVAQFIFTKGSSTVDAVTIRTWCVYYMGIYYDTLSPFMVIQNTLLTTLCNAANALLPQPIQFPSPPTVEDLSNILEVHGKAEFKSRYGFAFQGDQTIPDDISPGTPVQAAYGLLEIEGRIPANLDIQLQRVVFNKIQFPSWVSATAKDDLREVMEDYLIVDTGNKWISTLFSEVYPNTGADASDYATAAIVTFCNAQLRGNGITITVTYIHYIGVYYFQRKTVL